MVIKRFMFALVALLVIVFAAFSFKPKDTAPQPEVKKGYYVALGDSVAAGVGLEDYSDSSACDRTDQSYPKLLADKLQYELKSVACSGASTQTGLLDSQEVNKLDLPAQLSILDNNRKPDLITLTIGANDMQWTSYLQKCYTAVCGSGEDTVLIDTAINKFSANFNDVLANIKNKYPDNTPTTAVTGYYRLFGDSVNPGCTELSGIDATELSFIRMMQDKIDIAISAEVKKYPYAVFAPIDFSGHELCTTESWVQGIAAKKPYHPNAAGQQAIADQLAAINSLKGSND